MGYNEMNTEFDVEFEECVARKVAGTTDYTELNNKPKINSVELVGNKTLDELGIQPKGDYVDELTLNAELEEIVETFNKGIATKQDVLVSGTNIKTINNQNVLGQGNINIDMEEIDPTVPTHVKQITSQDIQNWNSKSEFSGNYNDLTNKPTIPTDNSQLTNGAGYQTANEVQTAINNALGDITGISYSVVEELPSIGEVGVIYLVNNNGENPNIYDEYIYVNNAFEKIGTTETDLSNYVTKTELENKIDVVIPYKASYTDEEKTTYGAKIFSCFDSTYTMLRTLYVSVSGLLVPYTGRINDSTLSFGMSITDITNGIHFADYTMIVDSETQTLESITIEPTIELVDDDDLATKQDTLVSGTNIKTINGTSILGSGNIEIEGGTIADWEETRPNNPAYIKNRPMGYELDNLPFGTATYTVTKSDFTIMDYKPSSDLPDGTYYFAILDSSLLYGGSLASLPYPRYCSIDYTLTSNDVITEGGLGLGENQHNGHFAGADNGTIVYAIVTNGIYFKTGIGSKYEEWQSVAWIYISSDIYNTLTELELTVKVHGYTFNEMPGYYITKAKTYSNGTVRIGDGIQVDNYGKISIADSIYKFPTYKLYSNVTTTTTLQEELCENGILTAMLNDYKNGKTPQLILYTPEINGFCDKTPQVFFPSSIEDEIFTLCATAQYTSFTGTRPDGAETMSREHLQIDGYIANNAISSCNTFAVSFSSAGFLNASYTGSQVFVPTNNNHPANKKYVDDHGIKVLEASTTNVIDFNTLTTPGYYLIKNANTTTTQHSPITDTGTYDLPLEVEKTILASGGTDYEQLAEGGIVYRKYTNGEWYDWGNVTDDMYEMSKAYANTKYTQATSYTDTSSSNTLNSAKSYTDTKVASAIGGALSGSY